MEKIRGSGRARRSPGYDALEDPDGDAEDKDEGDETLTMFLLGKLGHARRREGCGLKP